MRAGDAVVHALEKEGIRYITGFSGGGLAPLWPALRDSSTITAFATRHERLGVEVADGYSRATGTGRGGHDRHRSRGDQHSHRDRELFRRQRTGAAAHGPAPAAEPGQGIPAGSVLQHLRLPGQVEGHVHQAGRDPRNHAPGIHRSTVRFPGAGGPGNAAGRPQCGGRRRRLELRPGGRRAARQPPTPGTSRGPPTFS